jgi:hypothetical protein
MRRSFVNAVGCLAVGSVLVDIAMFLCTTSVTEVHARSGAVEAGFASGVNG